MSKKNSKNDENSKIIEILTDKIEYYKNVTKNTFICYKNFVLNNVYTTSEMNIAYEELHGILSMINMLEYNLFHLAKSTDELINDLQEINNNFSVIIKQYGTKEIIDMLLICFGSDYLQDEINKTKEIKKKFHFLNDNSNIISYKIVSWDSNKNNKLDEFITIDNELNSLDIFNICEEKYNFHIKLLGYRIVFQNKKSKQTIIITCILNDIPVHYINCDFIQDNLDLLNENKPKDDLFEGKKFDNFLDSLSTKDLLIYPTEKIYEIYLGKLSQVSNIKNRLLSKVMRDFMNYDLYSQRNIIIQLLLDTDDYENQYIAYLLYDILSNDVMTDSNDQLLLFNSFPLSIQNNFKYAMKNTIEYTKYLSESDIENKIPLEQRICLLKTSNSVKEKAMMKVKELKSKSDESSSSKVRHYLEGLLKIPFGIYRNEPILTKMNEMINVMNKIKVESTSDVKSLLPNKDTFSNIDFIYFCNKVKLNYEKQVFEKIKTIVNSFKTKKDLLKKIKELDNKYESSNSTIKELKTYLLNLAKKDIFNSVKVFNVDNVFPESIFNLCNELNYINNYLSDVNDTLNLSVYGHFEAKKQVERVIGQWINGTQSGYCFGFEGPPGVGKTSLVKNGIAKCLKDTDGTSRPFGYIAIGGSSNGSTLDGHNYTYVGSVWGKIVDILMESKCMNPIIFIDEIDKVSRTESGKEIIGILTHLVDQTQNDTFQDKYFSGIDLDLSKVLFIFSYNDVELMDHILLDRIHRVQFKFLSVEEKLIIVKTFIIPEICDKMGYKCPHEVINMDENVIRFIINVYTAEAGVRKLKEILYEIISEINLKILSSVITEFPLNVTKEDIKNVYLKNKHPMKPISIHTVEQIGIINGLWANSLGKGGIIQIESQYILSNSMFELKLTGMQGDVMKESMNVARSLAWKRTSDDIKSTLMKNFEKTKMQGVHIHCPEGAVPKDGPSAGTAISVCLYSLFNDIPIKNDIAITGEINLQGNVTAIGGLDLKILGGIMGGVKTFLFPKENQKDFDEFMEKTKNNDDIKGITFIAIETLDDAIKHSIINN
jgi:ATP-dependent Lon protease